MGTFPGFVRLCVQLPYRRRERLNIIKGVTITYIINLHIGWRNLFLEIVNISEAVEFVNILMSLVPEFIDPIFAKTSPKRSFSASENQRFGLFFAKTGFINSNTAGIDSQPDGPV